MSSTNAAEGRRRIEQGYRGHPYAETVIAARQVVDISTNMVDTSTIPELA